MLLQTETQRAKHSRTVPQEQHSIDSMLLCMVQHTVCMKYRCTDVSLSHRAYFCLCLLNLVQCISIRNDGCALTKGMSGSITGIFSIGSSRFWKWRVLLTSKEVLLLVMVQEFKVSVDKQYGASGIRKRIIATRPPT